MHEPMFEAIITAERLERLVETVNVLVDESKIHLNADETGITAVDPANVAMVDLTVSESAFESYDADGGLIGVNLNRLADVAGMADSDALVHLELDDETRKLHIEADGLEYTLALIDPESIRQEPDIPDLDLPAEVILEGDQLDRGIKASDMVSDHLRLMVDDEAEQYVMEAEGDTDDVHFEVERDDLIELTSATADSLFSLDYLKDLNKAFNKDSEVRIVLGEEFPAKLHFDIMDGDGSVTYMLAPRIQSD